MILLKYGRSFVYQTTVEDANCVKLAKASSMALISMLIIVVTVISQGWRVPSELRGELRGSLFINSGVFQAIGVISFGNDTPTH